MNSHLAFVAVVAVLSAAPTAAADFLTGMEALRRGDFEAALAELEPLAEQGHAEAQYQLGILYASGDGVDVSLTQAVEYYRAAAEQGLPEAQNALAFMYRVGNGVPQDAEQAVRWYRLAAEGGVGQAQYNLAGLYGAGKGVEQDYVQAYKWYSLAAMHGQDEARKALFYCADLLTEAQIREAQRLAAEWQPSPSGPVASATTADTTADR